MLQIANHGVIDTPGNAGTDQETFQDGAQNYYETFLHASPMILLGREYWQQERPAWPLMRSLAETPGKEHMRDNVHLVDTINEAREIIEAFRPPHLLS
ncbi:hypothetical protein [Stieleria varia]|uniref:Uncharacterized protein n=1 Tax=Stieleria varia TaxID=2528005 RepID=A0A5C6B0Z9_9BACT|nr:hypothetical protein [Stieleria varia]TWU05590.1 hypothetical protein Pla52n_13050 [Stieleria varia]